MGAKTSYHEFRTGWKRAPQAFREEAAEELNWLTSGAQSLPSVTVSGTGPKARPDRALSGTMPKIEAGTFRQMTAAINAPLLLDKITATLSATGADDFSN